MPHDLQHHIGTGPIGGDLSLTGPSSGVPGWLRCSRDLMVRLREKLREPVPADRLLPEQL